MVSSIVLYVIDIFASGLGCNTGRPLKAICIIENVGDIFVGNTKSLKYSYK